MGRECSCLLNNLNLSWTLQRGPWSNRFSSISRSQWLYVPSNQSVHNWQESKEELPGLPPQEVLRSRHDERRLVETLVWIFMWNFWNNAFYRHYNSFLRSNNFCSFIFHTVARWAALHDKKKPKTCICTVCVMYLKYAFKITSCCCFP